MARTVTTISSQYGTFTIIDDDGIEGGGSSTNRPVGQIYVRGPKKFRARFQYNTRIGSGTGTGTGTTTTSTSASSGGAPEHSVAMLSAVQSVNTKIKDITDTRIYNEFVKHNKTLKDMRNDIRVLRIRGENENLGIYQNQVCKVCEDDRALFISSLIETDTLDQVLKEKRNPSGPPDFL